MKRLFIFAIVISLLFTSGATQAQTWNWGKRLGSPYNSPASAYSKWDGILDITSDPLGNIYALTRMAGPSLDVDGNALTGHGGTDILITSFRCNGSYRWSKLIGTNSDSDFAISIKADRLGGVYVSGTIPLRPRSGFTGGHIGSDTTIGSTTKTLFLTKLDTSGNYKWLRMPQPDTISYYNAMIVSIAVDMDVDEQGNTSLLCYLTPGAYELGAHVVPTTGLYILKYGTNGQFIGGIRLPVSVAWNCQSELTRTRMTFDAVSNRYILSGQAARGAPGSMTIGSTALPPAGGYLATFSSSGALGFLKTGPILLQDRAKTDAQGNIYIAGTAGDSVVFNGVMFLNPGQPITLGQPFAMKIDGSTGAPLWTRSARTTESTNGTCLALANNKLLMGGFYSGKVVFPTDSFSNVYSVDSHDVFIAQLDAATGGVQLTSTLKGSSFDAITSITQDNRGNFYVGGSFYDRIIIGGTTLQNVGGNTDAFIAKWGKANCSCVLPAPSFTASLVSGKTMRYTYSGTTSGIDSLLWNWGDGQKQKITTGYTNPVSHTFAANGHYNVCVTAYNNLCGDAIYCNQTPLAIMGLELNNVKIYPNPASDRIAIEGAKGARLEVFSIVGQLELSAEILDGRQLVDVSGLSAGTYLLRLTKHGENSGTARFVKQ